MSGIAHTCHADRCDEAIPPMLLLCPKHWAMVPQQIRFRVVAGYRRGQEIDKNPSLLWCLAADAAVKAIAKKEGRTVRITFAGAFYPPGAMAATR